MFTSALLVPIGVSSSDSLSSALSSVVPFSDTFFSVCSYILLGFCVLLTICCITTFIGILRIRKKERSDD